MTNYIARDIQTCLQCQFCKTSKHKSVPSHPLPLVSQTNQCVHDDIFDPITISGNRNKLTFVSQMFYLFSDKPT